MKKERKTDYNVDPFVPLNYALRLWGDLSRSAHMRLVRKGLLKEPVTLGMRRRGYLLSYVQAVAAGQAGN